MILSIAKAPSWQRQRALLLHQAFTQLESDVAMGAKAKTLVASLSRSLQGKEIIVTDSNGKEIDRRNIGASVATLWRLLTSWRDAGRTLDSLLPKYNSAGSATPIPESLVKEIHRLATRPVGGRNKHGDAPLSFVFASLVKDWKSGKPIPGLGTWQDWWINDRRTCNLPMPTTAPEFPWTERSIRRHAPCKALRAAGNIGDAAASKHRSHIIMDYSKLRKCELYTLDDVRMDPMGIDDATGNVVEVQAYIMMEVASRSIVAFMLRPAGPVKQEDVDELIARALQTPGYGIGTSYTTHILFERGSVACTEAAQEILEAGSGGRIKVHRTSMKGTIRWVGAPSDKSSGNSAGKGVIESFNRMLHHRLLSVPGQRGNKYENSPANLGFEDRTKPGETKKRRKQIDTLTRRSETLGQIRAEALMAGIDVPVVLPTLLISQLQFAVRDAINDHNNDPGHDYQGHGTRTEIEVAPGVWKPIADYQSQS